MEGEPADLTVYADNVTGHDHAYYGNGCPGLQTDGSKTPCSTRLVNTFDGETLKNGTYYNFQAATSGTGGTLEPDNTNSSDTFCPLGWQLPYGGKDGDYYDQSKSWRYLFTQYGIVGGDTGMSAATSYPFSLLRKGGLYSWYDAKLYNLNTEGDFQTTTVNSQTRYYWMMITENLFYMNQDDGKANGRSLRCVSEFTKDSSEKPIEPLQTLPAKSPA